MPALALMGGTPVIDHTFRPYNSIGEKECDAVRRVMESGVLSKYVGAWSDDFYGGPEVRQLEKDWCARFRVGHAVAVNSATSGLYAALGAIGLSPGEEVIVPPYTMSATAMAPLIYGGIPVFADIEPDTFCLDPEVVIANITDRTRAILAVNIFGHPAALAALREIADRHDIWLIEDNAQSPLAMEGAKYAGTIGHIGVFSLNYHKHFHCGEGGICVTDDAYLAKRLEMIRNHGENVVDELGMDDLSNMVGFNYRMTEVTAAVAVEQLKDADRHVARRVQVAEALSATAGDLPGITPPLVREGCSHVYYNWASRYDEKVVGVPRELFSKALTAEGFPNSLAYVKPLYMLPLFQKRIAIGKAGYPFNLSERAYSSGLCPVAERMNEKELLGFYSCGYDLDRKEIDLLCEALKKVYDNRESLLSLTDRVGAEN
ncbi:MAG: DegT/DnrJ/EryC1/StrS family aminotransferase [Candidatus Obscuribacterales bacterium]